MPSWTHQMCERCWFDRHTNEDGTVLLPMRVRDPICVPCCFCDKPTIAGIFVRSDPTLLKCEHPEEFE